MKVCTRSNAFQATIKYFGSFYILFGMLINCVVLSLKDNNYANIVFIAIQMVFTFSIEPLYINLKINHNEYLNKVDENKRKYFYINNDTSEKEINILKKYCCFFIIALTFLYFAFSYEKDLNTKKVLFVYKKYFFLENVYDSPFSLASAFLFMLFTAILIIIIILINNNYIYINYYQKYYNLMTINRNLLNKEKKLNLKKEKFSKLLYYSNEYDMSYSFLLDRKEFYENKHKKFKYKKVESKIRKNNDKSKKYLKKIKLIYLAKLYE
ncbi:hypothetical protein [Staphylococcus hominis]|uniref:hypothetical protein n=1 Tax=Staphylococcus hominis TaxID=1290 RepID=UPI00287A485E|nr:hypothetical protein [Staphylococcus hominis]MDS3837125.1 hypothetical protein [Staphylococcus hominis]